MAESGEHVPATTGSPPPCSKRCDHARCPTALALAIGTSSRGAMCPADLARTCAPSGYMAVTLVTKDNERDSFPGSL